MTTEAESLRDMERNDPFAPHDPGCHCWPHVSQRAAIEGAVQAATREYRAALTPPAKGLDVERLRNAIYAVSVRHNWATKTDTEDRTEEIAAEYATPPTVDCMSPAGHNEWADGQYRMCGCDDVATPRSAPESLRAASADAPSQRPSGAPLDPAVAAVSRAPDSPEVTGAEPVRGANGGAPADTALDET